MSKVTYTERDTLDSLNEPQIELLARSDCSLLVRFLEENSAFDAHRVRLLLEMGRIEAVRRDEEAKGASHE